LLHILYIGIGGFIGAVLRYITSRYLNNLIPNFPLGTLAVNIAGSFVLGFILYSLSFGKSISTNLRDFITIGFIGGFTTMSAFAYESFRLFELNEVLYFSMNLALNIFLCLTAVYFGKELALLINK
jgi:CrcB protein